MAAGSQACQATRMTRYAYLACGWLSLSLGVIGTVLPLLPTVPFVLLAAFCFSKGSERLHQWLLNHKLAGHHIRDWQEHRIIRKRSKVITTVMMSPLFAYAIFLEQIPMAGRVLLTIIPIAVLAVIWSFPSERAKGD